ncbi:MAG: sulfur carrier protein ThiS [Rhodothermaceae bacterium]
MKIVLNNNEENFASEKMTIRELLNEKNFTFKLLVVKINGKLVKKDKYEETYISDGDKVIVMHMVSGG